MSLPDGKTWLQPVEPAAKPMSLGWKVFLTFFAALLGGSTIWQVWDAIYWASPPTQLSTTIVRQAGVIYYSPLPVRYGRYSFTLVTLTGEHVDLSCQPVYRSYSDNRCLEPIAENGIAQWRPDWRKAVPAGPVVNVSYVQSDADQRFNNVVFSLKRGGVEYLDPRRRLSEAGIDPTGQSYSEARFKAFRRQQRRDSGR